MARKLRIQFEGAIYHVTIRGVERRRIFDDDADRERFLARLGDAVEEYGVRLYLFTCMRNHAHLLCETPQANLSAFMHKLQTAYTVYYNLRHRRAGHLMQGRFGAELVAGDEYLLKLSRYIHLNPVFVRQWKAQPPEERIRHLHAYPWSSFRGYVGMEKPYGFMDEVPILMLTENRETQQRRTYQSFVEAGIAETDDAFRDLLKASRWGIGDEAFQSQMRDLHTDRALKARRPEDVSFRRVAPPVAVGRILEAVSEAFGVDPTALRRRQYGCVARAAAAFMLGRYAGMNQRDIGVCLGMGTGSAVCLQLRRLRERSDCDGVIRKQIAHAEAAIKTPRRAAGIV